jgi:hypothetical protein
MVVDGVRAAIRGSCDPIGAARLRSCVMNSTHTSLPLCHPSQALRRTTDLQTFPPMSVCQEANTQMRR